jgi:hypothetical protein
MSAATTYLQDQITKASTNAPSVTWVTSQRSTDPPRPSVFRPGLVGYGWGYNGTIVRDTAGQAFGLQFSEVYQWFSDRKLSSGGSLLDQQRFAATNRDVASFTFLLEGDVVRLSVVLVTWHATWETTTATFDVPSQQLVFSVPGAGPNAPRAVMLISFAPTGKTGEV